MTVSGIIQARMSSTRFPGKVLADLNGQPLIAHVCNRLQACSALAGVVVATSDRDEDSPLADTVRKLGVAVYRGDLDDVLGRLLGAARSLEPVPDAVVRITGDCPLVDPDLLASMLRRFADGNFDYLSNVSPPTFPDGFDLEIVRMSALDQAHAEAKERHEREHVTPFLRERPDRFRQANVACPFGDLSDLHLSIDRPEDLDIVRELLRSCSTAMPRLAEILDVLEQRPDLKERCRSSLPNEGAVKTFRSSMRERAPRPVIRRSNELWERALRVIPGGTQTLSKAPNQFVCGFGPKYLVRGQGSHVWDADGNEFIDYPMGLGPVTLGHGHPEVVAAVADQLARGNAFSLLHPLEVELAERISSIVPCAEMVRFGKNGSDATSACVRGARALTGRKLIARCGYHGWQDWSIDRDYGIRAKGVPAEVMDLTVPFPYNDPPALEKLLTEHDFAAVILEPVSADPPKRGYLEAVRELATKYGAVLVFDEVITGFRYARGGAQEYFGVTPDLAAMGKGVANGLPLSIVAGKREFMKVFDEVFFSFTFGGEASALAAARATLDVMEREDYWTHVWRQGGKLQEGFRALARDFGLAELVDCGGMAPWTVIVFRDDPRWSSLQLKTLFQQEMIARGILFSGSQFISLAHSDTDVERTLNAYRESFRVLRFAIDTHAVTALTEGSVNELVFRRM